MSSSFSSGYRLRLAAPKSRSAALASDTVRLVMPPYKRCMVLYTTWPSPAAMKRIVIDIRVASDVLDN